MDSWLPIASLTTVSTLIVGISLLHMPRVVRTPTAIAFVLHLLVGFVIFAAIGVSAPDAYTYLAQADRIVDYWSGNTFVAPSVSPGKEGYPYLLAVLFHLFGTHPQIALIVNAVACTFLVPVIAATANRLPGGSAKTAAWITAAFPPFYFWGGLVLREAITWLLLALIAYAAVRVVQGSHKYWFLIGGALLALLPMRGSAAILVGAAVLGGVFLGAKKRGPFAVVIVLVLAVAAGPLSERLDAITGRYTIEQLSLSQSALARGASQGQFPIVGFSDPISLMQALPGAMPRVLFGPLPWEWGSVGLMFVGDGIVWLILLFCAVRGWRRSQNRRQLLVLILPALALLVILAVSSGNYGTMQRLRDQAVVFMIPMAAIAALPERERLPAPSGGRGTSKDRLLRAGGTRPSAVPR